MSLRIIVLGASGMIGSGIYKVLCLDKKLEVFGTIRSQSVDYGLPKDNLIGNFDVLDENYWREALNEFKPDVVINCIGITKHIETEENRNLSIGLNAIFPHKLVSTCDKLSSRLIHISTDCIFSGREGFYSEKDIPDATDLYGITKKLGEIHSQKHLTLRTSTIGHEINSKNGLLEWFLSQEERCKGFKNAIFSGLTTEELGLILRDKILLNDRIGGVFNLSSEPISKFDLLTLFKKYYSKSILIEEETDYKIDRSLNSNRLKKEINYKSESWEKMIKRMAHSKLEEKVV